MLEDSVVTESQDVISRVYELDLKFVNELITIPFLISSLESCSLFSFFLHFPDELWQIKPINIKAAFFKNLQLFSVTIKKSKMENYITIYVMK